MFASFRNFLYRHRRKFVVSGVVVGGTILAINYAQKKILEWQEKEAKEFLKKTRKEQHYRSTERTCNQTIFSLSKTLKETILRTLDSDAILQKIREGDGSRITHWEELKVVVFAQICSLIYAGLMLVLLLRIQLNIIGGYMVREDKDSPESLNASSQEKYLSLCQHFIEKSVGDLCTVMKKHSALILKDFSLKQKLTLQDIENVFWRLESSLNEDPNNPLKNLPAYLIPEGSPNIREFDRDLFQNVVSETVEVLKNEEIISIAESSVKRAFSNTVDKIAEYYVPLNGVHQKNGFVMENGLTSKAPEKIINVTNMTVPLAKIIPILHGLYRGPLQNGCPDPWIEQFVLIDQLSSLGASIYEAFSSEETA